MIKMKRKIYEFLDNEEKYVSILTKEIVETFQTESDSESIEYSFTISKETGLVSNEDANTFFKFDTNSQTVLHDFKKALFDEDLNDIKEGSVEEKNLMEAVRKFLLKICNKMTTEYLESVKETIRRVVLGNKVSEEKVPLKTIQVLSIDIADYSSVPEASKYLLRIGKTPGGDINTDDVIRFVQDRQELTGMDIETVFNIEKQAGNPIFKNVLIIEKGRKFLNEIYIYFFIDYSTKEEEIEEEVKEGILEE